MKKTYPYGPIDSLTREDLRSAASGCEYLTGVLYKLGYSLGGTTLKRLRERFIACEVTLPGCKTKASQKQGGHARGQVQQIVMNLGKKELEKFIARSRNWSELADAVGISRNSNSNAILRARILQVGLEMPYKIRRASKKKKSKQIELPHSEVAYQAPIPMAALPNVRGAVPPKVETSKGSRTLKSALKEVDLKINGARIELDNLLRERATFINYDE